MGSEIRKFIRFGGHCRTLEVSISELRWSWGMFLSIFNIRKFTRIEANTPWQVHGPSNPPYMHIYVMVNGLKITVFIWRGLLKDRPQGGVKNSSLHSDAGTYRSPLIFSGKQEDIHTFRIKKIIGQSDLWRSRSRSFCILPGDITAKLKWDTTA